MPRFQHAKRALALLTLCFTTACASGDPTTLDPSSGENNNQTTASAALPPTSVPPAAPGTDASTTAPAEDDASAPAPAESDASAPPPASTTTPPPAPTTPPPAATTPAPAPTTTTPPATTPPATTPPSTTTARLRGTNLVGMEGDYTFNQSSGPTPDGDYAVHSTQIVDYLVGKKVNFIRFLFSWERMQSTLGGPIPAATSGNYKSYFDDYKRIVDYATAKGVTVLVEPWQANSGGGAGGAMWRGNLVGGGTVTSAHFADFWSKMAAVYASNPRVAIGLANEPNGMSTMSWFATAQAAITAIRGAGFTGDIHVPGNGWTGASSWTSSGVDSASPQRSNAYGWLNARGVGQPLLDPLGKLVVNVHSYADANASGSSTSVVSTTVSRTAVSGVVDWARANGLRVFVGEIGMYAAAANASANWTNFVSYMDANTDTLMGFAWWACGKPGWWNDVAASGGGHFSITPTGNYNGDTVNMTMIQSSFGP